MNLPRLSGPFNLRLISMAGILVVLWIFFRLQVGEFYFSGESIAKLSRDMVSWTILAAGMTLVIVAGQIDLSVGSLLALAAASCALMINTDYGPGLDPTLAVPLAILMTTLLGAFQGVLTAYGKVPSFIVTLGGMFIFRGITQKVSAFDPRVPESTWIVKLGYGYIPPDAGWIIGAASCIAVAILMTRGAVQRRKAGVPSETSPMVALKIGVTALLILGFIGVMNGYRGIPDQTLVMAALLVVLAVLAARTRLGRHLYAIGGNVEAARLAGVRVERRIVAVFAIMGLLAGIAGVIWMAQNQGSTKNGGQFYELYAIAAAVIGGASLMGGRGTVFGTFLGGLVMATVIQGMDYTNFENWLQLVVRGSVLVIAVGLDMATRNPPEWFKRVRAHQLGRLGR